MPYAAWGFAVCGVMGAAVYMITIDQTWWAVVFVLLAASWGITSSGKDKQG